jgi:DNA invertase Pin-like site-specific DNA recombinase
MTPKRAISYIRASINEDKQKHSHNIQRDVISAFASRHCYELEEEFSEYHSGTDDNRPEFRKALDYAAANNCYVIIYRLDRCARTLTAFSLINDVLPRMRFVDMGDIEPNLMLVGVMLTVAAQESINTSIRLKATIKHLKAMNPELKWGNHNLYIEQGAKAIAVRQSNASKFNAYIKKIVADLRLAGYASLESQVSRLNSMGITTRRGKPFNYHSLYRVIERT